MVNPKHIIEALRHVGCASGLDVRHALANRIESEGIAPPDGWVLVPSEPTSEMVMAAWDTTDRSFSFREGYRAMLATAPKGVSDEQ